MGYQQKPEKASDILGNTRSVLFTSEMRFENKFGLIRVSVFATEIPCVVRKDVEYEHGKGPTILYFAELIRITETVFRTLVRIMYGRPTEF